MSKQFGKSVSLPRGTQTDKAKAGETHLPLVLGVSSMVAFMCGLGFGCGGADFSGSGGASGASASSGGGASASSTGTSSMNSSTTGSTPASCVPSDLMSGAVVDSCGVFVSTSKGNDGHSGLTKADAVKTLAQAIVVAGKGNKRIYACGEAFMEGVTLPAGFELYGALDCATDWSHGATKTTISPSPDIIALTLSSGSGTTHVEDVAATALDAGMAGDSSIAVLANGVTAELVNCDLTAGAGADGAAGATVAGTGQIGMDAPTAGLDGCTSTATVSGGNPGQSMCGGITTDGGPGGAGTKLTTGGAATNAPPFPITQPNSMLNADGLAGISQNEATSTSCRPGDDGADGLPSMTPGAGATGIGGLTAAGYVGPLATGGQSAGAPGYGGGGGGGAAMCGGGNAGPAGGGGGSGGCGGKPGGPGQSAGSSIGLLGNGATLTLNGVTITAVNGGAGGVGGNGQPGGSGGVGADAGKVNGGTLAKACNGGSGGQGSRGDSGGGGLGGHSIGIASMGGMITQTSVTVAVGTAGKGGDGGDMNKTAGVVGGDGQACKTLAFDGAMACMN